MSRTFAHSSQRRRVARSSPHGCYTSPVTSASIRREDESQMFGTLM